MATLWDTLCKVFARGYPHALLRLFNVSATFVQAGPTELKEVDRKVDNVLEVVAHGQRLLLHIEFQSTRDSSMAKREVQNDGRDTW
jgi:hypothetical protein